MTAPPLPPLSASASSRCNGIQVPLHEVCGSESTRAPRSTPTEQPAHSFLRPSKVAMRSADELASPAAPHAAGWCHSRQFRSSPSTVVHRRDQSYQLLDQRFAQGGEGMCEPNGGAATPLHFGGLGGIAPASVTRQRFRAGGTDSTDVGRAGRALYHWVSGPASGVSFCMSSERRALEGRLSSKR